MTNPSSQISTHPACFFLSLWVSKPTNLQVFKVTLSHAAACDLVELSTVPRFTEKTEKYKSFIEYVLKWYMLIVSDICPGEQN